MATKTDLLQKAANIIGNELWCQIPFREITIFSSGDVFPCSCPDYINQYSIGNIYKDSTDEILYGEKAKKFQQSIIDGTFEFCNLDMCLNFQTLKDDFIFNCRKKYQNSQILNQIEKICINLDTSCNVKCKTCRDVIFNETQEQFEHKKEIFENTILPIFYKNDVKEIFINGSGEIFTSKISLHIIDRITKNFPDIKFIIITNGLLFNERMYKKYSLKNKIKDLFVSIHASTKETYEKIVRGGNFDTLKKNIEFAVNLKNKNEIGEIYFNFVVSSLNFREMISFQEWANELNVKTHFTEYRPWGGVEMEKEYTKYAVFNKEHEFYEEFKTIVHNDIFKSNNCYINLKLAE